MTTTSLLEELAAADAQGERAVSTLWPGDEFYWKKRFWKIERMQWHDDRKRVYVITTEPEGEPYELVNLKGETISYQPLITFLLHGLVLFPAMLSDEHAREEQPAEGVW